jgi:excisionase family DNA binding protein
VTSANAGERLLTTSQVAEVLNVSESTVLRRISEGAFPHAARTKPDTGDWRISQSDVDAYLESTRRTT